MKRLMVLTSHNQLGHTSDPTGFWLKEFATPDFVFKGAGIELTLASPKGGQPPLRSETRSAGNQTPAMARFKKDVVQKAYRRESGRLRYRFLSRWHRPMSGAKVLGATPSRRRPLCQVRLA